MPRPVAPTGTAIRVCCGTSARIAPAATIRCWPSIARWHAYCGNRCRSRCLRISRANSPSVWSPSMASLHRRRWICGSNRRLCAAWWWCWRCPLPWRLRCYGRVCMRALAALMPASSSAAVLDWALALVGCVGLSWSLELLRTGLRRLHRNSERQRACRLQRRRGRLRHGARGGDASQGFNKQVLHHHSFTRRLKPSVA